MEDTQVFALVVLVVAVALLLAVASSSLSERIRVPAPALFLIAAAAASDLVPALGGISLQIDERIVTVCLLFILFDGGMHIGWRRFRAASGAIAWIGVAGTAVTAAAIAVVAHLLFGLSWELSLLLGAALSPTDPAVVFSVLGKRDIAGRSGTLLEGESGFNDPVGIALLFALLAATTGAATSAGTAIATGIGQFALQMAVGAVIGAAGGWSLSFVMRRIPVANGALSPLRTLAIVAVVYGVATLLQGSGFLAVFVTGILVGDIRAPYKADIRRFSAGVASLAEIVAFTILGLSVSWKVVLEPGVLFPGLALAALLILLIRPLLVGVLLIPVKLAVGERAFVLWAGLKGAVPILLGMAILGAEVPGATQVYGIIFVVVLVSVVVQGGLVPAFAALFRVPLQVIEPAPFAAGMRFREDPESAQRHIVAAGSAADGASLDDLPLGDDGWISMIARDGRPVPVNSATRLAAGDEVLAFVDGSVDLGRAFSSAP